MKIRPIKGKAWCGVYRDGQLGWVLPEFLDPRTSLSDHQKNVLAGIGDGKNYADSDFYRVEITIRPILNRRGKHIVRRAIAR